MGLKVITIGEFDKKSIRSINQLVKIAKSKLKKYDIIIPKQIEFYNDLNLFIERIKYQVRNYGLSKLQSKEFIRASLNIGIYCTVDIEENIIIAMNYNPFFKGFFPAMQFLKMIIHESLHLFLYANLDYNIYSAKFKFNSNKYIGNNRILQLDEGFAGFLTDKILEDYDFGKIRYLPIYSELLQVPKYQANTDGLNIKTFNIVFDTLYVSNSKKGYRIMEKIYQSYNIINKKGKVIKLLRFVQTSINNMYK